MKFFLNSIYLATLLLLGPWLALARLCQKKSLRSWPVKFTGVPARNHREELRIADLSNQKSKRIWIHAVSVGEVNLVATLIGHMKKSFPNKFEFVITTSTDTGFELASKKFADDTVCYCPWDFTWSIANFIRAAKPECLILAELEIWPNTIEAAKQHGLAVVIANGRLSEKSFRGYRKLNMASAGLLQRRVFEKIDLVLAQNSTYAERFKQLGCLSTRVKVSGSVKFDGAKSKPDESLVNEFKQMASIASKDLVFLAGSTQAGEDEVAMEAFLHARKSISNLRLMIAPRHPNRAPSIAAIARKKGLEPVFRSQIGRNREGGGEEIVGELDNATDTVFIIDSIGELSNWWATADIAFVGGSLGNRGGQNMIEPAALGCAVCFGPNTRNFRDVVRQLLDAKAVKVVRNESEMSDFLIDVGNRPTLAQEMAVRANALIEEQRGATKLTIDAVIELLENDRVSIEDDLAIESPKSNTDSCAA